MRHSLSQTLEEERKEKGRAKTEVKELTVRLQGMRTVVQVTYACTAVMDRRRLCLLCTFCSIIVFAGRGSESVSGESTAATEGDVTIRHQERKDRSRLEEDGV